MLRFSYHNVKLACFAILAKLNSVINDALCEDAPLTRRGRTAWFLINFQWLYLDSVRLYKMHVQCGCVGENLSTSFNGAKDVGPHFFGQLRDGGLYYFPWLRHFLILSAMGNCVRSVIRLGPCRGSNVFMLTIHPALDISNSAKSTITKHSRALPERLLCYPPKDVISMLKCVISDTKCFRFSKQLSGTSKWLLL